MSAVYLDSSAVNKLILEEAESAALAAFLAGWPERLSSALARVEVGRALLRAPNEAGRRERARQVLAGISLLALDDVVLTRAAAMAPPSLRSLDAIHIASALSVPGLAGMVVYDRRLASAAAQAGLRVWAPGQPA